MTIYVLVLGAAGAQASTGVSGTFGEAGSGDGQLNYATGVAVYDATGDVYVADLTQSRVLRFDEDGNFELAFGWGVADGSAEAQVCSSGCQAGVPGSGPGQLSGTYTNQGIAVDQSDGSLYVWNGTNYRVDKFDADGHFLFAFGWGVADSSPELQTCTTTCQAAPYGSAAGQFAENVYSNAVSVDPSSGNVLVTDPSNQRVQEFDPSGSFVRMFGADVDSGGGQGFEVCTVAADCKDGLPTEDLGGFSASGLLGIAVDSNGVIYTAEPSRGQLQRFTPSTGTLTPSFFGSGLLPSGAYGPIVVAVDPSDDHVVMEAQTPPNYVTVMTEMDSSGALVETYFGDAGPGWISPLAFNPVNGRGYAAYASTAYILEEILSPEATILPADPVATTTVTLNGLVNSAGEPAARYHFEWSIDGGEWLSSPEQVVPGDSQDHHVSFELSPLGGLEPNREYQVRLVVQKPFNAKVFSTLGSFTTQGTTPTAETIGTPFRTATTAQLQARINARNSTTTYYFEYGTSESYGARIPASDEANAGNASQPVLAAAEATGLQAGTTYHYRVVATNAVGTTVGGDRTVTTRATDSPLTHGHLAGPPESDRAYELVSIGDSSGNGINGALGFSDDGNRALYQMNGGTPISDNGTYMNQLLAERTPSGWKPSNVWPKRGSVSGTTWKPPYATDDLSTIVAENFDVPKQAASYWRMGPGKAPEDLYEGEPFSSGSLTMMSDNGERVIVSIMKPVDPQHPAPDGQRYWYDVSDGGTPRMVSLLPDESVPACPVDEGNPSNWSMRSERRISADGSLVFFSSRGNDCGSRVKLYARDIPGHATTLISDSTISGPDCDAQYIKSNADAVYFTTQARLDADDVDTNCEGGNDVYRYDLGSGARECITCVVPGAEVIGGGIAQVGISNDGSRVYFTSLHRLLAGEGVEGQPNIYRLNVAGGDLAFVAPGNQVGEFAYNGEAMTRDGSEIVFASAREGLNALTGSDNGGTTQYYVYDDRTRSLTCVSCPAGKAPLAPIDLERTVWEFQVGPNTVPISDGGNFVFMTTTPLVNGDQNTARPGQPLEVGTDVYEWRDGRILLISDGKQSWPGSIFAGPGVAGITPNGRDVFFQVSEQLTPDALDGFKRLYDARIGGGFEFPKPPPPCPLEICQGEAKGAPNAAEPGTTELVGPGDEMPRAHRRHQKHKRCKKHGKRSCKHRVTHKTKAGGSK